MKKFTVSFLITFLFCTVIFSGSNDFAVRTGVSAAAFEILSTEEEFDAEICYDATDWSTAAAIMPDNFEYLYNEDTFSFYDQLDANNKSAYDEMKVWLDPTDETIAIPLPSAVAFQADSANMSNWDEDQQNEFWTLILSNIKEGKTALTFDYPELFWLDESKIYVSISSVKTSRNFITRKYTLSISEVSVSAGVKDEYTDVDTAKEFQSAFENAVDNFVVEGGDNYSKIKYIHDTIINTVHYDLSAPYYDTALGFFTEPYGIVCEGYSKAVKILCDKENIPCILVVGNINLETNFAHMWNYIQMEDGKWYALDCTWDDLDSDTNPVKYQYFLKGSDSFSSNHTPDDTYITPAFTYPELSETDYVYASSEPVVTTAVTTSATTETTVITTAESSTTEQTSEITSDTTEITEETTTAVSSVTTVSDSVTVTDETSFTSSVVYTDITEVSTSTQTSVPETTVTDSTVVKGDFNRNGILDTGDAVMLSKKLIKKIVIEDDDLQYELNDDQCINIWDYIILIRKIQSV